MCGIYKSKGVFIGQGLSDMRDIMINGVFGQKGKSTDDDLGEEVTVIMSLKTFVNNEYYIQSKIDTSEKSDIYIEKLK